MLWVIYGNDDQAKMSQVSKIKETLVKKNYAFSSFDSVDFDKEIFEERINTSTLFESNEAYIIRGLLDSKKHKAYFERIVKQMVDSDKYIISVTDKAPSKKIEKEIDKKFFKKLEKKKIKNNEIFSINDAKGKKERWLKFRGLRSRNYSASEILGIMLWETKNLVSASKSGGINPGMSPFVYKKSLAKSRTMDQGKIIEDYRNLITISYSSFDERTIETALEKFILS